MSAGSYLVDTAERILDTLRVPYPSIDVRVMPDAPIDLYPPLVLLRLVDATRGHEMSAVARVAAHVYWTQASTAQGVGPVTPAPANILAPTAWAPALDATAAPAEGIDVAWTIMSEARLDPRYGADDVRLDAGVADASVGYTPYVVSWTVEIPLTPALRPPEAGLRAEISIDDPGPEQGSGPIYLAHLAC